MGQIALVDDDECGCVVVGGVHHAIPDDGAPHLPSLDCACVPDVESVDGRTVVTHVDQDAL